MIELSMNNITKFYGANKIFEHISFEVKTGERIGLIGSNGCGKTTLMKILMGVEDYQEGTISFRKGTKVGYLNQIPVYEEGTTVMDVLQLAFEEVYEIKKHMLKLEQRMARESEAELDKTVQQYSGLLERYEHSGGYEIETRIGKITEGLQINEAMQEMLFDSLSGGEKTRVILAKILLEEPDILLLDEPTNHLDLITIGWLEGFLKEYKGAAVIISHDRFFLDSVVKKIIELEYDHAELYLGNYSYYVAEKERRFLLEFKDYKNQQKKIERMEEQIKRYRIWDSEKMYRRAKELEKRLEKIDVLDKPIKENRKIRLLQNNTGRSGKLVLEVTELSKAFGERELLKDVSFTLFYQDSACIIGENGSGKTTLLKMILGEEEQDEGSVKLGAQVKIGYLPQQVAYPDEELTVLEYFAGLHNISYGAARSQLAKVLFMNEDVNKKIKILSGGEKSRLKLCSLTFEGVNVLILDEPTNHLDIVSREVLEETLCEFEGTLLFVSHDRYFIDKVADKIMVIEDKGVTIYNGDYTYYQEEYQKRQEWREAKAKKQVTNISTNTATKGLETDTVTKRNAIDTTKTIAIDTTKTIVPDDPTKRIGIDTTTKRIVHSIVSKEMAHGTENKRMEHNTEAKVLANEIQQKAKKEVSRSETHIKLAAKKVEQLEELIGKLEEKLDLLEQEINLNSCDGIRLNELYIEKVQLEQELQRAYDEWEKLVS